MATTSAWLVLSLVSLTATLVGSVSLGSPMAASGVGLAAMVVVLLPALWEPAERYSLTGLTGLMFRLTASETVGQWRQAWTTLAYLAASAPLAVAVFQHREL